MPPAKDSLPMQLYKSLPRSKKRRSVCRSITAATIRQQLVVHPSRSSHSPNTFNADQRELIRRIFDSLHSAEHQTLSTIRC